MKQHEDLIRKITIISADDKFLIDLWKFISSYEPKDPTDTLIQLGEAKRKELYKGYP